MEPVMMNEKVHQTPEFGIPVKTADQAKAFFRLLWFGLGLDFNPDDDFGGYGVFDDDAVAVLNRRMDECFDVLGAGIYDVAFAVMQEDKK